MNGKVDLMKMKDFYEYDADRNGRELAHDRLDIILKIIKKKIGRNKNRKRYLDIGISDGYLLRKIKELGLVSHGADISFSMLKNCFRYGPSNNHELLLTQCLITDLPFRNGVFDVITACEILEHLDDNGLQKALGEIVKLLNFGGYLIITTPYKEQTAESYVKCPGCGNIFPPSGHYSSFDENKWLSMFKDIDVSDISIKKIYGTDFRLKKMSYAKPIIGLMAKFFAVESLTKLLVVVKK